MDNQNMNKNNNKRCNTKAIFISEVSSMIEVFWKLFSKACFPSFCFLFGGFAFGRRILNQHPSPKAFFLQLISTTTLSLELLLFIYNRGKLSDI